MREEPEAHEAELAPDILEAALERAIGGRKHECVSDPLTQ
jgi:hypothetical protein